jgi:CBS domain-containing protein
VSISTTDLTVGDVLLPPADVPVVRHKALLKEALEAMTTKRLGIASVLDDDGKLAGIFTDGDIRRMLLRDQKPFPALFADDVLDHAVRAPTTVTPEAPLAEAVSLMEERGIWDLPVVDADGCFMGLLHLHPAIKALLGI